jgi:phosphoserine / homoserine phosphotransferase
MQQSIVTLDMEGVLTPEIWIAVADKTGIPELRRTTRDEPDYDKLMRYRIEILDRHGIKLSHIQEVIGTLRPLPGALEFLNTLRSQVQTIILSDTFEQFAQPLMRHLGMPTIFCHHLVVEDDRITGYRLRQPDQKRCSVEAFRGLEYKVIAAGDSYNDTTMLGAADAGFLFRAPDNVIAEFPQFPAYREYGELLDAISAELA